MALGEALMEEQTFRRLPPRLSHALVHKFPSMLEYKSPTTLDMPEVFTELVENPDPSGPFGAKEVGQGPLLPVMPAVANAVYDAVGVRIDEVPITPEKILKALDAQGRRARRRATARRASPTSRGPSRCRCRRRGKAATGRRQRQVGRQKLRSAEAKSVSEAVPLMMRLPYFTFHAPRPCARRRSCSPARRPARCWSPAAPTCCRT